MHKKIWNEDEGKDFAVIQMWQQMSPEIWQDWEFTREDLPSTKDSILLNFFFFVWIGHSRKCMLQGMT